MVDLNDKQNKIMQGALEAGCNERESKIIALMAGKQSREVTKDEIVSWFENDIEMQGLDKKKILSRIETSMRKLRNAKVPMPYLKKSLGGSSIDAAAAAKLLKTGGTNTEAVLKEIASNKAAINDKLGK